MYEVVLRVICSTEGRAEEVEGELQDAIGALGCQDAEIEISPVGGGCVFEERAGAIGIRCTRCDAAMQLSGAIPLMAAAEAGRAFQRAHAGCQGAAP